jgi:membrane-associated phospholipid phosphatase
LRRFSIALLCFLFAALAVLVALGAFAGTDQYATGHWMPGLDPNGTTSLVDSLLPVGDRRDVFDLLADAWLYPASAPVTALIFALVCRGLWFDGRRTAAAWWAGALVAGTAVEILVKHVLARPALYVLDDGIRRHVTGFDQSLPSGHTFRSALIAALVLSLWPRLGRAVAGWAASVAILLVVAGWHTPTDIAGGLLLAALCALVVHERVPALTRSSLAAAREGGRAARRG